MRSRFITNSPQGDGNFTQLRPDKLLIWFSGFITKSPQGDGNLLSYQVLNLSAPDSFITNSPQGDGNKSYHSFSYTSDSSNVS